MVFENPRFLKNSKKLEIVKENLNILHRYIDLLLIHEDFAQHELNATHVGGGTSGYLNEEYPEFSELRMLAKETSSDIRRAYLRFAENLINKQNMKQNMESVQLNVSQIL